MARPTLKPAFCEIPPLRDGDRLSRDEFERRFDAMPDLKRAELIEGIVYMSSRVPLVQHGEPHLELIGWMGGYQVYTPGVEGGVSPSIRLDMENEPQPDGVLFIQGHCGGQSLIDADGYIVGPPELTAEVSASTIRLDIDTKFNVYRRNKVREYLIWRVDSKEIDWHILRGGNYEPLRPSSEGFLKSEVFPGLWLDPAALVRSNLVRVHEVIQQGLKSPEHAQFVARLQAAGK
jgi:Uma2 family endonuclease